MMIDIYRRHFSPHSMIAAATLLVVLFCWGVMPVRSNLLYLTGSYLLFLDFTIICMCIGIYPFESVRELPLAISMVITILLVSLLVVISYLGSMGALS